MYNLIFVDDENRVLEVIKTMIDWNKMGIRVIGWCNNALSALELMINERPDILVTDIKMPLMDGLELISRAKEMYPDLECLVISGHDEFELARSAIKRGVRGYLLKPCAKEELESSIKECVEAIKRSQYGMHYNFEQRRQNIECLCDKLMALKFSQSPEDETLVYHVVAQYNDFSLLREATLMAVVQHEQMGQNLNAIVKGLSKIQGSDELIRWTVDTFREINKYTGISDPVVAKMVAFVHENYNMSSLTLQYVADNVIHLTARYIGGRFFKTMNMKFSDYLLQVRMEKAIEFLRETGDSNADDIANRIGLGNNVQYFYRLFRQYTGMTLKEYRDKMIRGELN